MPITRMIQRRGTAQQWIDANPVLAAGEIGYETDTGLYKFGDGTNPWLNIPYRENAELMAYDNVDSGLTSTNVQAALDEIDSIIDTHKDTGFDDDHGADHDARDHSTALSTASLADLGTKNAIDVDYDNSGSGLAATNVKTALDELDSDVGTHTHGGGGGGGNITAANVDYDNNTSGLTATDVQAAIDEIAPDNVSYILTCTDETSAITSTGTVHTFRMPHGMSLTGVRASLTDPCDSATPGTFIVDINEGGASILSTTISIDPGETTSTTAATPPVISDSALADDAEITIDIDDTGDDTATGLKVYLIGTRV